MEECLISNSLKSYNNESRELNIVNSELIGEARKKKKKENYLLPLVLGAVLVKMILFPLAVKAMAVMSSVSLLLSTFSLIMSSIVGYAKLAMHNAPEPLVKLVHVNDVWAKGDELPQGYISDSSQDDYSPNIPLEQIHFT
ncbi:unnamed protein product [Ceutorhynchus assimilis]|uniref:Uncharacterized protein n=1 Tax=Ceutorhynchus assimilis TaxID=467358 RepID=A0A9P0GNW7_9CUCU|nr:unnamed protein product [Ceutorhynchus assimilis]